MFLCFWIIQVTRKKRRRKWLQLNLNLLHNGMHYSTHPVVLLSVVVGHALIGTAITEVAVVGVTYIIVSSSKWNLEYKSMELH